MAMRVWPFAVLGACLISGPALSQPAHMATATGQYTYPGEGMYENPVGLPNIVAVSVHGLFTERAKPELSPVR